MTSFWQFNETVGWDGFDRFIAKATAIYKGIAPDYVSRVRDEYEKMTPQERETWLKEQDQFLDYEKRRMELNAQHDEYLNSLKKLALKTKTNTYERVDYSSNRIVCSNGDPKFDKIGMPLFEGDLKSIDSGLVGYNSIHVGDWRMWLPVMARDQYCDGDAYIYDIDFGKLYDTKMPFYEVDDYHIMDATNLSGKIVFSKRKKVPAAIIKLIKVIKEKDIPIAPDPY